MGRAPVGQLEAIVEVFNLLNTDNSAIPARACYSTLTSPFWPRRTRSASACATFFDLSEINLSAFQHATRSEASSPDTFFTRAPTSFSGLLGLDFRRLNNTLRGTVAEYIVGQATGSVRRSGEWDPVDITTPGGEVKSAAYLQSWHQKRPSISFSQRHFPGIRKQTSTEKRAQCRCVCLLFSLICQPS